MKAIFALSLTVIVSSSYAATCTNFSGKYHNPAAKVFTIEKGSCDSFIQTEEDGSRTTIPADGQFRVTEENNEVKVLTAGKYVGENFMIESKIEYKVSIPSEYPSDSIPSRSTVIYSKDAKGNVQDSTTVFNSEGKTIGVQNSYYPKI